MKKLSKTIALVAITTLLATAFTTNHFDQPKKVAQTSTPVSNIPQVVIVGKRMTAFEKAQYDLTQTATLSTKPNNPGRIVP